MRALKNFKDIIFHIVVKMSLFTFIAKDHFYVLCAFQKVVKTGYIGKKSSVASSINYERYFGMQKVNRSHLIVLTISVITTNQLNVNT